MLDSEVGAKKDNCTACTLAAMYCSEPRFKGIQELLVKRGRMPPANFFQILTKVQSALNTLSVDHFFQPVSIPCKHTTQQSSISHPKCSKITVINQTKGLSP